MRLDLARSSELEALVSSLNATEVLAASRPALAGCGQSTVGSSTAGTEGAGMAAPVSVASAALSMGRLHRSARIISGKVAARS